jgi:outer membrane receptor protein involved in Fe transport
LKTNYLNQDGARELIGSAVALLMFSTAANGQSSATTGAKNTNDETLAEIVVTATRREETINTVPLSMTAYDTAKLDAQGIVSIDDLALMTPGVTFSRTRYADTTSISIRGIASSVGAATTGVYVDDTPVQVRTLGFAATNLYPENFDLQRVEVLRGPQGTLFGAGSEGGTVRFITTAPSLTDYSGYARADGSYTQHGSPNGEAGLAFGGPIVKDTMAFRVSGWFDHDGGYIDRVSPVNGGTLENDANHADNYALRAALRFVPTDAVDITLSTYTQDQHRNNGNRFYERFSDPSNGVFQAAEPIGEPSWDKWWLTSLNVQIKLGNLFNLISVTSDLNRSDTAKSDYSQFFPTLLFGPAVWDNQSYLPLSTAPYEYQAQSTFLDKQNNFVQEIRLQTTPDTGPFSGTLGLFYSLARQSDIQTAYDPTLNQLTETYFGASAPDIFGVPFVAPNVSYISEDYGRDKQTAIFGDAGYEILRGLKVDAGFRYQWSSFAYHGFQAGPWTGSTGISTAGDEQAHPFTPRFYVSYQLDDKNLVYASASKGFRIGGANKPIPTASEACTENLDEIGYGRAPPAYSPDSLWNYEIGSKNGALNGRLQVNSSLFYIKWSNIQQSITLPACGFNFVGNLGSARSMGADIQADMLITRHLSLSLSAAYTDAYYTNTVTAGGTNLVSAGDALPVSPWSVSAVVNYEFMALGWPSFARFTYSFDSHLNRLTPALNPNDEGYDAASINPDATRYATLRLGAEFLPRLEASIYVDNLFDSAPLLTQSDDTAGSKLLYGTTLTPRTIGGRVTYRF